MINFYVDGACSGNPGPGGYGVVRYENDEIKFCFQERCENTTNNRMELSAILYVIKNFGKEIDPATNEPVRVWSDSSYAVSTINLWMYQWATNGWKRSRNQVPENLDLIKEIYELDKLGYHIRLLKIPGHSGYKGNELADALATGKVNADEINKKGRTYKCI